MTVRVGVGVQQGPPCAARAAMWVCSGSGVGVELGGERAVRGE